MNCVKSAKSYLYLNNLRNLSELRDGIEPASAIAAAYGNNEQPVLHVHTRRECSGDTGRHHDEAEIAKDWDPAEYRKLQYETAKLRKILEDQSKVFQGALDKLQAEAVALDAEIALYNRRKPRIRRKAFFRDDEE